MCVCVCVFHTPNSHLFKETPAEAAARECAEETMGVLGTKDHLLQSVRHYEENNVFKVSTVADGHRDERERERVRGGDGYNAVVE